MKHSDVVLMDKDKGKKSNEWRTSQTHFLSAKGDEMLKSLDERVEVSERSERALWKTRMDTSNNLTNVIPLNYIRCCSLAPPCSIKNSPCFARCSNWFGPQRVGTRRTKCCDTRRLKSTALTTTSLTRNCTRMTSIHSF